MRVNAAFCITWISAVTRPYSRQLSKIGHTLSYKHAKLLVYTSKLWAIWTHFASYCGGPVVARRQGVAWYDFTHAKGHFARVPFNADKVLVCSLVFGANIFLFSYILLIYFEEYDWLVFLMRSKIWVLRSLTFVTTIAHMALYGLCSNRNQRVFCNNFGQVS